MTNPYPNLTSYVFSRTLTESRDPAVALIAESPEVFVRRLLEHPGKPVWLCGGGDLAGQLLEAGLIERLVIKLNPIVLGDGIPLFRSRAALTELRLVDHKVYEAGVVRLTYERNS